MERWKRLGEGRLDFAPSQSGAGEPYGFQAGQALGAVRLVERDGQIQSGAAAVFRMMELCGSRAGSAAWAIYKNFSLFRAVADWGYARVAERRATLSKFSCKISTTRGQ
jgi:predicted DCC family thiol-disulfide oxidoreductase YuxK